MHTRLLALSTPALPAPALLGAALFLERVWLAATGGLGPAPALAPGMLALGGVCLLLGTLGPRVIAAARAPQVKVRR